MLSVHRLHEGLKAERTACINRIRGLLAEFGLVFAQSPSALQAVLAEVLEDAANEMNTPGVFCTRSRCSGAPASASR